MDHGRLCQWSETENEKEEDEAIVSDLWRPLAVSADVGTKAGTFQNQNGSKPMFNTSGDRQTSRARSGNTNQR